MGSEASFPVHGDSEDHEDENAGDEVLKRLTEHHHNKGPEIHVLKPGTEPKDDGGADDDASKKPEGVCNCNDEQAHGLKAHAEVNAKSDPGEERPHQENDFDDCDQEKNEKFRHGESSHNP